MPTIENTGLSRAQLARKYADDRLISLAEEFDVTQSGVDQHRTNPLESVGEFVFKADGRHFFYGQMAAGGIADLTGFKPARQAQEVLNVAYDASTVVYAPVSVVVLGGSVVNLGKTLCSTDKTAGSVIRAGAEVVNSAADAGFAIGDLSRVLSKTGIVPGEQLMSEGAMGACDALGHVIAIGTNIADAVSYDPDATFAAGRKANALGLSLNISEAFRHLLSILHTIAEVVGLQLSILVDTIYACVQFGLLVTAYGLGVAKGDSTREASAREAFLLGKIHA